MKTIFGPVHSRRFGTSLGIDLSPSFKQCNFDCLYCELAPAMTIEKQHDVIDIKHIINELQEALSLHSNIDVLTLTANGEPTMYPHLNDLLTEIAELQIEAKTLILTNAALLHVEEIYTTLLRFDKVKLSLDAVSLDIFNKIDRPHESIHIEEIVDALKRFSKEYKGELFIEILFVHELNDIDSEIEKLNETLLHVENIARVDIGSIDRPPAYPVMGISFSELFEIAKKFDSSLPIHIASRQHAESNQSFFSNEEIVNTLDKRPLTQEDIELLFDTPSQARLKELVLEGLIVKKEISSIEFYVLKENLKRKRQKA